MKFKTPVAYTKLDRQKEFFSPEALKGICETTRLPLPVTNNFSYTDVPIGRVTELEFKKDRLIATIELNEDINLKDVCFRVGGAYKKSRKAKIGGTILSTEIKEIELLQISKINKAIDVYDKEDK